MRSVSRILLAAAIVLAGALGATGAAEAGGESVEGLQPAPLRVLLVGNSYSRFNDLPGMLERMAASVPDGPALSVDMAFKAGVGLDTHWKRGIARRMIRRGDYTHVVLQGHSRAVFDAPHALVDYATRFSREIDEAGARPVMFATWARHPSSSLYVLGKDARTPLEMQSRIDAMYGAAAEGGGAEVAAVGDAWLIAIARRPRIGLHRGDASHPTPTGTYLAACVLYGTLTGVSPERIGYAPRKVTPGVLPLLRAVAAEVVTETGRATPTGLEIAEADRPAGALTTD
jgi:hypothetical protein